MTTVERTRVIAAKPDDVWRVLADVETLSSWAPRVEHSCLLTEQADGVGAVRRVQVGHRVLVATTRDWAPRESLSYEIAGLPSLLEHVASTWTLEADRGGTKVTLSTAIDAGGRPLKRLATHIIGHRFGSAADEMLDGLAERVTGQEADS